jgi:P27 family predicted phage terminase small subunit
MAGRKPIPPEVHALHGNPGKRKLKSDYPKPKPVKNPSAPDYLDSKGRYVWRVIVAEMENLGILGKIDLQALARWCDWYSVWRDAIDERKVRGATVEGKYGPVNGPWIGRAEKASNQMRAIESNLGIGGAANRVRLKVEPSAKPKDPAEAFESGKKIRRVK